MGSISEPTMKLGKECLLVLDSRTMKSYQVPIQDNYVQASDLSKIKSKEEDGSEISDPLRILDHGLEHIACMKSSITLVYVIILPPLRHPC